MYTFTHSIPWNLTPFRILVRDLAHCNNIQPHHKLEASWEQQDPTPKIKKILCSQPGARVPYNVALSTVQVNGKIPGSHIKCLEQNIFHIRCVTLKLPHSITCTVHCQSTISHTNIQNGKKKDPNSYSFHKDGSAAGHASGQLHWTSCCFLGLSNDLDSRPIPVTFWGTCHSSWAPP